MPRLHLQSFVLSTVAVAIMLNSLCSAAEPTNNFKIKSVDSQTGLIIATDDAGGTVQFTVKDPAIVRNVKVGDTVQPDFNKETVTLTLSVPLVIAGGDVNASDAAAQAETSAGRSDTDAAQSDAAAGARPAAGMTAGAADSRAPQGTGAGDTTSPFTTTENPQLKGRLGRLIVAVPEGADASGTKVTITKAGDEAAVKEDYGALTAELLPGKYDVIVSGKRVGGADIQSKNDTVLTAGVLRIQADSGTKVEVKDGEESLYSNYGTKDVALPPGTYTVEIAGQAEQVEIKAGEILEF